jgi:transposase
MCGYFERLRTIYPDGVLVVMLDSYSAHRSEIVKEYARGLKIKLLFIPPRCTDRLQPLERRIFGILKTHARRMWRKHYHETNSEKELREMMTARLLEA